MKLNALLWIIALTVSCSGVVPIQETGFEKQAIDFLSKRYPFTEKQAVPTEKDSLRGKLFYSDQLKRAVTYNFLNLTNKEDSLGVFLTVYTYTDSSDAISVVNLFKKDFSRRLSEGFYGPLGKHLQLFFSSLNQVVHLEMQCGYDQEAQMRAISDSVMNLSKRFLGPVSASLRQPCQ